MILDFEDIVAEMYDEFPDVAESSINKICRDGLIQTAKMLRSGKELIVKCPKLVEVKFFIPGNEENQFSRTKLNQYKDKLKKDGSKLDQD